MNIVFFGTSEFAMPALRMLLGSRHKVQAVVTQPDRQKGRRLKLSPPLTKVLALERGIPVYQPVNASGNEALEHLRRLNSDLFVVVSFGQILKREILTIPKSCAINLHGSLLPKYRGAAPTNWAVINGDSVSGVTVIRMNEKMDEGDIILRRELKIDKDDTNITLGEGLSELGAKVLSEAIDLIESKKAVFTKQSESEATYAPKLRKKDGLIDWNESAIEIHNKVRGLVPWPSAYTHFDGKVLKILKTELDEAAVASKEMSVNGTVIDILKERGILVKTGSGDILITYVQLEGKKPMNVASFLRGHRLVIGQKFLE